jgi:hypothetical protein
MMRFAFILALAGCGVAASVGQAEGPLELGGALAYLDLETGAIIIVDPDEEAGPNGDRYLHRVQATLAPAQARSLPRPDDPSERHVVVLDPGGEQVVVLRDKRGTLEPIAIGLPFDAFDVSSDGRYALAYQPEDQGPQNSLFAFPNAVAVVDLGVPARATALRLPSASARPRHAAFAESCELRTGEVTIFAPMALVFVEGGVVPVDLAAATAGAMVPLGSMDDVVVPQEVVFSNNRGDLLAGAVDGIERAFVRGSNGELYVLSMTLAPLGGQLRVALENVVTPDAFVHDIELFFADDGRELLLAAAGDELVLVDGYTGVASRFPQEHRVDTLARFVEPTSGRALALGYGQQENDGWMVRVDPLGLDARRASGLSSMRFADSVRHVDIAGGAGRAVLRYDNERTLGVLELTASGEVLDVQMATGAQASALSPDGDRLLIVGLSPTDDEPHLAEVTLAPTLASRDVRLDLSGQAVGVVGGYIYVDHGSATGAVTFFPDGDLRRRSALSFADILFTDVFDTEVQP